MTQKRGKLDIRGRGWQLAIGGILLCAASLAVYCGGETIIIVEPEPPAPPATCALEEQEYTGEATYYDADGTGNCSFPATRKDPMVAAMNETDYAGSSACGACVAIDGPDGSVTVRIVDRCPACPPGDIDLSPEAFAQIAELDDGRVPISWRYVPCASLGPIFYHFKEGSNPWWTAVQIRNHDHPIAKIEYLDTDGTYREVSRASYNYFVETDGMGAGPYTLRVTDVLGQVIEDTEVPFMEGGEVAGAAQFPACTEAQGNPPVDAL